MKHGKFQAGKAQGLTRNSNGAGKSDTPESGKVESTRTAGPPGWGRRVAVIVFSVFAAIVLLWLELRGAPPSPPLVKLDMVDAKVAELLSKHLEEVRLNPRSAAAWGWLGALLRAYDYRPEACECLTQAEHLEPGNPRWPYYHALVLLIATPNQAIPFFQRAVQICGNNPEGPRLRLARLLAEQGRWEEARLQYEPLLAEHPDFAPARLLAAKAASAKGDAARGIELAQRCAQDPRTARSAWILLATLYRQAGDMASASQAVQRSAALAADEGFGDSFEAEATRLRGDSRF